MRPSITPAFAAALWVLLGTCWQPAKGWQFHDAPPIEGAKKGVTSPEFAPKQWRVNTTGGLLTIFMPVIPTEMELGYARNQLRTFERLFDLSTIREWMIVTPPDHIDDVKMFFSSKELLDELPHFNASMFRVVHDGECAPELMPGTQYSETPKQWKGWIRQQLVKLACASLMHTPFYLIMDSDVFVARPMGALNLFETDACTPESVVCDTEGEKSFRCANDCYPTSQAQEFHKNWWRNSAETLQLEFPLEWDAALGVTPQILSTDVSLGLGKFIQERFGVEQWGAYLLDAYAAKHIKNWEERQYLGHDPAWTEYSIYFIFAQHARAFEQYHAVGKILQWNAIWEQDQWEKWDACKDTFEWDWGYLGLVQSRLKLPPQAIWAKMKACWDVIDARPKPPPPPPPPSPPPPPVLVYEQPKPPVTDKPKAKPKADPNASLGVSQPYTREGNTFSELLSGKQNASANASTGESPPGVHVNRQSQKGGVKAGLDKLFGAVGRAPPLSPDMEQHLLELATGGSMALELLHDEHAPPNTSAVLKGSARTPIEQSDQLHFERQSSSTAQSTKPGKKGGTDAGMHQDSSKSALLNQGLSKDAVGQQSELLSGLQGTSKSQIPKGKQQQQLLGGLTPLEKELAMMDDAVEVDSLGSKPGARGAREQVSRPGSKTANPNAIDDVDIALQTSSALNAGGKKTSAVVAEHDAAQSGSGPKKSPITLAGMLVDGVKAISSASSSKRGAQSGKAQGTAKKPHPSERASNARLTRSEARRQSQARRLEAADRHQSI